MNTKLKVYVAIALVFLLGMISGGMLVMQMAKSRVRSLTSSSTLELSRLVLEHLDRQLGLATEQREAVAGILAESLQEVGPLRAEFRREALSIVQKYRSEIDGELNPQQRAKFERIVGSLLENWKLESEKKQPLNVERR